MQPLYSIVALLALLFAGGAIAQGADCKSKAACSVDWMDAHLRLNDLQAIGTHNSYKQAISPGEFRLLTARNPRVARTLDYAHAPLRAQLDAGARQIEIDVLDDPAGGRYAAPRARQLAAAEGAILEPFDVNPLQGPGFKVLHVQDLDYRSSCATLALCLAELRAWSQAHPRHIPILVMMNLKRGPSPVPGGVEAPAFDDDAFERLDAALRAGIPAAQIITPDEVQGRYPTLRDAVHAGNWPTLGAARGRFLFAIDELLRSASPIAVSAPTWKAAPVSSMRPRPRRSRPT